MGSLAVLVFCIIITNALSGISASLTDNYQTPEKQIEDSCTNTRFLRRDNSIIWKCTLKTNCAHASNLSLSQTVICGEDKLCCPHYLPPNKVLTTTSLTRDEFTKANRIALNKCYEYAAYRYHNYTIPGKLIGDSPIRRSVLECPEVLTLILGGEDALPNEFPHMAWLGYNENVTHEENWHCSGSLISEQFILSAARCTARDSRTPVKWAALGLSSLPSKESFTTDKVIGKNIIKIIHQYWSTEHVDDDIALYKLEKPVALSPFIRPICIHQEPLQTATIIVTGWRSIGFSENAFLKKVMIFELNSNQCETRLQNGFNVNTTICGGYSTGRTGIPLCDSGAPVQIPKADMRCMWLQVGVSSGGARLPCDGKTPGIYARISAHLPWIQKLVWPTEA